MIRVVAALQRLLDDTDGVTATVGKMENAILPPVPDGLLKRGGNVALG